MAAAAEHGGGRQQWQRWATTAMADDDSGGQRRWRMMTACKVKRRTTRGEVEGGRQTTTVLGQPGRERETKKEFEFMQKGFFQRYGLSGWSFCSCQKQTPFLLDLSVFYHNNITLQQYDNTSTRQYTKTTTQQNNNNTLQQYNNICKVSNIPYTHAMSRAVMLYIHTLLYVIPYC